MSLKFNPDMLRLARESRGLSQIELCDKLKITQGSISKIENGLSTPSEDVLGKIAKVLQYPVKFFKQASDIIPFDLVYYRRRLNLTKVALAKAEARMNIIRHLLEKILEGVEIPTASIFNWNVEEFGEPSKAALHIRSMWNVPRGKIHNPFRLLEDHGYIIIPFDFGDQKIDGVSMITRNLHPLIFVNKNYSLDRQLLTVYHEFGHLVMHFRSPISMARDVEKEAFEFASEFLVPTKEFENSFTHLDLAKLADLKMYWNLSMGALIMKAASIGKINRNQQKYLWAQMSKLGYRKKEPEVLDIKIKGPSLLPEIAEVFCEENRYSLEEMCEAFCLYENDLIDSLPILKSINPEPKVFKLSYGPGR